MAYIDIPGSEHWEYDSNPPAPTAGTPEYDRWNLTTAGIRTSYHLGDIKVEIYAYCRMKLWPDVTGELSKTLYDTV